MMNNLLGIILNYTKQISFYIFLETEILRPF